jgi:alanine dehydrogenase
LGHVLLLKNADVEEHGLLPVGRLIAALEVAYRELAAETAQNRLRQRIYTPLGPGVEPLGAQHWLNILAASVPGLGVSAVRLDSALAVEVTVGGVRRKESPGDFAGFVLLFDLATARLLACIDDHALSTRRVAGTSALGTRALARPDASVLAVLGSGTQAEAHVEAMLAVRPVARVRVFSPNRQRRTDFAAAMAARHHLPVEATDDAESAVRGADIICCCTNTVEPALHGAWLEPGSHVNSIVGGDNVWQRREIDEETYRRAAVCLVHNRRQAEQDHQADLAAAVEAGVIRWDDLIPLDAVVAGAVTPRRDPDAITVFKNNTGMGLQFCAAAAVVYEEARRRGVGRELPDELFHTVRDGTWAP